MKIEDKNDLEFLLEKFVKKEEKWKENLQKESNVFELKPKLAHFILEVEAK